MTYRNAGPSLRSVVMSLKRIPSVGKSLMSRIFALRSAISIGGYLTPDAAVRKAPKCPRLWHRDTRDVGDVRALTALSLAGEGSKPRIFSGECRGRSLWHSTCVPTAATSHSEG